MCGKNPTHPCMPSCEPRKNGIMVRVWYMWVRHWQGVVGAVCRLVLGMPPTHPLPPLCQQPAGLSPAQTLVRHQLVEQLPAAAAAAAVLGVLNQLLHLARGWFWVLVASFCVASTLLWCPVAKQKLKPVQAWQGGYQGVESGESGGRGWGVLYATLC